MGPMGIVYRIPQTLICPNLLVQGSRLLGGAGDLVSRL